MGVFHFFQIVQMLPNRATYHICLKIIVKVKETRLNVKDRNKNGKPNLDFNKKKSPEKKVTITRNSMIKYLRRENLSSRNNEYKIPAHPGSTTKNIFDYIKPVVRKKPDLLVIHNGRNDFTNGVITINDVRELV